MLRHISGQGQGIITVVAYIVCPKFCPRSIGVQVKPALKRPRGAAVVFGNGYNISYRDCDHSIYSAFRRTAGPAQWSCVSSTPRWDDLLKDFAQFRYCIWLANDAKEAVSLVIGHDWVVRITA